MSDNRPLPSPKSLGTVLVVGGCGFVGRHVVDQLLNFPSEQEAITASLGPNKGRYLFEFQPLAKRYPSYDQSKTTVHALDLRCVRNRLPGCTYHEADITNPEQLLEVFREVQPDVVINTASPQFDAPKAILKKVNIEGTRTLLEVAGGKHGSWSNDEKMKCKAFVHTSSSSVIHDALSDIKNADERWPYVIPNAREYYSETKAIAEQIVLDSNGSEEVGGMLTAAVRPAGITGEFDMGGFAFSITKHASMAPGWQMGIQMGEGDNLFDTTYVGNVALALLLVAEGLLVSHRRITESGQQDGGILEHERIAGEAFIVTNDQPTYFWELTRFIYSRYGRPTPGRSGVWALPEDLASIFGLLSEAFGAISGRKGRLTRQSVKYSCMDRYFSCEKLKRRCGYVPVVDVEEGLARSVAWFKGWEEGETGRVGTVKKSQ